MAAVTPTPTFAPTGTYVLPPSHSVTYFTPAPSCSPEKLWLISTQLCNVDGANDANGRYPPWAECALTQAGDPHPPWQNPDCYPWNLEDGNGGKVFISDCPVGYTTVWKSKEREWYYDTETIIVEGLVTTSVEYKDIVAHSAVCCPENKYGGFHYNWDSKPDYIDYIQTIDPSGNPARVSLYVPPRCVATSVCAVPSTVTLDAVFNGEVGDKKRALRRQDSSFDYLTYLGQSTRAWDPNNVIFANSVEFGYTVFHGTYTCFENCYDYASYSYHNTDPNVSATSVGPDTSRSTTDFYPTRSDCEDGPAETGGSLSPSGTGGTGYSTPNISHGSQGYNATFTGGYGLAPSGTGGYNETPEETEAGAPSPSPSPSSPQVFPGSAIKQGFSAWWALFAFAMVLFL